MKLTDDDKKLWEAYAKTVTPLAEILREATILPFDKLKAKQKPISTPTKSDKTYQATIDLHGMTQTEAHNHLEKQLSIYKLRKLKTILVITGKGGLKGRRVAGVLRKKVPLWLEAPKFKSIVRSWKVADRKDGGEGALYVRLI